MRIFFRAILILIAITIIVIQFFQPQKNEEGISSNHILKTEKVPEGIITILENACLDCHSNNTNYKWYHRPAPVSWMINKHIVDGKKELNFSEWGKSDIFEKITMLEEVCSETERNTMPLKSYTLIHRKAKLSAEQKIELCLWTESLSKELLNAVME